MPIDLAKSVVPPLKLLCDQAIMAFRSDIVDFEFIKDSLTKSNVQDFAGYNTSRMRGNGVSPGHKTLVKYSSIINKTPANPFNNPYCQV